MSFSCKKGEFDHVLTGLTGRSKNLDPTVSIYGWMLRDFRISELRALLNSAILRFFVKTLFGRLHLWSHSFGHYSTLMSISENGDKKPFWKKALPFSAILVSWQSNSAKLSLLHYLTYSGIQQFFVLLPSLVNATPIYLNFSTGFSVVPFTCNTYWSWFHSNSYLNNYLKRFFDVVKFINPNLHLVLRI